MMEMKGTPPTLEWIAVERLSVDPEYQRATDRPQSKRMIAAMAREWDWSLCQPLVVSRRADGSLFIIDGQHRHAGASARGDIPHLPCVVLSNIVQSDKARAFVAINTRRQKPTQSEIFSAMLAAGDSAAQETRELMQQTGWRLRAHGGTAVYNAGDLGCAPTIAKVVRSHGSAVARNALAAMREAWPTTAVRNGSTMFKALAAIYRDGDLDGCDPDLFIETIGQCDPADWEDHARDYRRKNPALSRMEAITGAMMEAYRDAARDLAA